MSDFDRTLKSAVVRRLEVLSGDLGRRRWADEVKARIVVESFTPGAVVSGVARRHGLSPQQLFTWRRQARRGDLVVPVSDEVPFVPILPTPMDAEAEGVEPPPSAEMIEIVLGGAVVRVPPEVDGKLLAKVLRAVKAMA